MVHRIAVKANSKDECVKKKKHERRFVDVFQAAQVNLPGWHIDGVSFPSSQGCSASWRWPQHPRACGSGFFQHLAASGAPKTNLKSPLQKPRFVGTPLRPMSDLCLGMIQVMDSPIWKRTALHRHTQLGQQVTTSIFVPWTLIHGCIRKNCHPFLLLARRTATVFVERLWFVSGIYPSQQWASSASTPVQTYYLFFPPI